MEAAYRQAIKKPCTAYGVIGRRVPHNIGKDNLNLRNSWNCVLDTVFKMLFFASI